MVVFPKDFMPSFCMTVGHVVVNWALLESSFNQWTAMIYQSAAEAKNHERQVPLFYKRKKKFLRRCFKQLPILAPFKDEALSILDRSVPMARVRDCLVHGQLSEVNEATQTVTFAMVNVDPKSDIHTLEYPSYTMEQMLASGSQCQDLSMEAAMFCERLANALIGYDPSKEALRGVDK